MTADQAKAMYRRLITQFETVVIRRYSGAGVAYAPTNYSGIRARVTSYMPQELIGNIQEGDRKVILLQEDLEAAGFSGVIRPGDKVVVGGKELAIIAPDSASRRVGNVVIAYELTARGG